MAVEMKPGMWKRRDGTAMTIRLNDGSQWVSADGYHYWDDGRFIKGQQHNLDMVEFLGDLPQPEPDAQPDAAEELAALRDDRDRWQGRAKQAEGRVATLGQEWSTAQRYVSDANEVNNRLTTQVSTLQCGVDHLQRQLATARQQVADLQAQLDVAAHSPDRSADLERVARERDAAREEVRGLQVRAEQAEGDARQANAKLGNLEGEVVKSKAWVTIKNDSLLRAEAANDALQLVIINIVRELRNDE